MGTLIIISFLVCFSKKSQKKNIVLVIFMIFVMYFVIVHINHRFDYVVKSFLSRIEIHRLIDILFFIDVMVHVVDSLPLNHRIRLHFPTITSVSHMVV